MLQEVEDDGRQTSIDEHNDREDDGLTRSSVPQRVLEGWWAVHCVVQCRGEREKQRR